MDLHPEATLGAEWKKSPSHVLTHQDYNIFLRKKKVVKKNTRSERDL